jgi:hypothetical protein
MFPFLMLKKEPNYIVICTALILYSVTLISQWKILLKSTVYTFNLSFFITEVFDENNKIYFVLGTNFSLYEKLST